MLGGARAGIVVLGLGVSLLAAASPASACGPEAYLTAEELASGMYDTTPPPWDSGAAHTHDVEPSTAPSEPPAEPAPPATGEDTTATAPTVRSETVQAPATGRKPAPATRSAETPAADPRATPRPEPRAAAALDEQPVATAPRAAPNDRAAPADRAERARARADSAEQRAAGGRAAAALDREPPARTRAAERPADAASTSAPNLIPIAAIGLALTMLAGVAVAVSLRRRPEDPAPAVDPAQPPPPAPTSGAEIEAALQEILAEEEAARALSPPLARR